MTFIRNAWYAYCWGEQLAAGQMFPRTILGEPVVAYRLANGSPTALQDRCPHRFVPLHLGTLVGEQIQCGYHGLRFDCAGECTSNPHGNGVIPPAARIKAYPMVERFGLLWIWMGTQAPNPAALPDYSGISQSEFNMSRGYLQIEANYELMGENLLDLSHITYLHDGYLGSKEQVGAEQVVTQDGDTITCRRWMPNISVPKILDMVYRRDGVNVDMWTSMKWMPPCAFLLDNGVHEVGGQRADHGWYHGIHILTPETEDTTHYHFAAVMPAGTKLTDTEAREFARLRRFAFEEQDKPMIEAQQRALGGRDFWDMKPALFSVDAAPVRMRRIIQRLLQEDAHEASRHRTYLPQRSPIPPRKVLKRTVP